MPCYGPLRAWKSANVNPETGRRSLVFRKDKSHSGIPVEIPCGQCIGCRLERSRQWALRCMHEMKANEGSGSAFLTLTYRERELPLNGSLRKRDLQLFMKRLRKVRPNGLRFFACGEYGEKSMRPHFHVLLLNTFFPDARKRSFGPAEAKYETYVSAECSRLWTFGDHVLGSVSFESCAYVARYCTKVISGDRADGHYNGREPEFAVMSRRPGIGLKWFDEFHAEWYRHDSAIVESKPVGLTRYYDEKLGLKVDQEKKMGLRYIGTDNAQLTDVKVARRRRAVAKKADNTSRRRWTKERLAILTMQHFAKGDV